MVSLGGFLKESEWVCEMDGLQWNNDFVLPWRVLRYPLMAARLEMVNMVLFLICIRAFSLSQMVWEHL